MLHSIILFIAKSNWRDEMDNFLYFTIFKGFLIFFGLFTSNLNYFDAQITLKENQAQTKKWFFLLKVSLQWFNSIVCRDFDIFVKFDWITRIRRIWSFGVMDGSKRWCISSVLIMFYDALIKLAIWSPFSVV